MTALRDALRDVLRVPGMAAVLLWRHGPTLLALCLLGLGLRQGIVWPGVILSAHSSVAAVLLLPFAGLSMLVALIAMLWVLEPSLPHLSSSFSSSLGGSGLSGAGPSGGGLSRASRLGAGLGAVTGMLIPFLAVHASQGLLAEDSRAFIRTAADEEARRSFFAMDLDRVNLASGWALVALIVVVFLLRRAIELLGLERRWVGFGVIGAYLEALWLLTLGVTVTSWFHEIGQWILQRRIIAGIITAWEHLTAALGPLGSLLHGAVHLLGGMSEVVVVPVAWLTVGALVYRTEISARHAAALLAADPGAQAAARKAGPTAPVARSGGAPGRTRGPLRTALDSLRTVSLAGLLPMVMFCLVFVVATHVAAISTNLTRALIGPHAESLSLALEPYAVLVGRVLYFLVVIVLLGAAIDRIIVRAQERGADLGAEAADQQARIRPEAPAPGSPAAPSRS